MKIKTIIISAFRSLKKHKIRTFLTIIGIIIGIASIICVMAIGEGAKARINNAIKNVGTNFIIALSSSQKQLKHRGRFSHSIFTPEDVKTILSEAENIELVSPGILRSMNVSYSTKSWLTQLAGVSESYVAIRDWKLIKGNFFTKEDVKNRNKVAVIGDTVWKEVFEEDDPIGKTLRIQRVPFKVIGVLEKKGQTPDGKDQDDTVFVPITSAIKRLIGGKERYFALLMSSKDENKMDHAVEEVRAIIRQKQKIPENQEDNFVIFSQTDMLEASDAAASVLNFLLLIIASISLIVGGIGIMNIMLVTVTERTKEIGIRMALGATTNSILIQFLLESLTVCMIGGFIGIATGVISAKLLAAFLGWPIFIPIKAVIISFFSSAFIGISFGFFPAYNASQLKPVEALIDQ